MDVRALQAFPNNFSNFEICCSRCWKASKNEMKNGGHATSMESMFCLRRTYAKQFFDLRQHPKPSSRRKIDHAKTYNMSFFTFDGRVWQGRLQIESKEYVLPTYELILPRCYNHPPWLENFLKIRLWRCTRMTFNLTNFVIINFAMVENLFENTPWKMPPKRH